MKRASLVGIFLTFALGGCGQAPFPNANLQDVKQKDKPKPLAYQLEFEEVMDFYEGRLTEYKLSSYVPDPGKPVITIEGMPDTATLTSDTKVSWTPPPDAGFNPADPTSGYREYRIKLHLKSSADPGPELVRTAVLLVHHTSSRGGTDAR